VHISNRLFHCDAETVTKAVSATINLASALTTQQGIHIRLMRLNYTQINKCICMYSGAFGKKRLWELHAADQI